LQEFKFNSNLILKHNEINHKLHELIQLPIKGNLVIDQASNEYLQALYRELILYKKNLSQIKLPQDEHLNNQNKSKLNVSEKNKNVNLLTRSKLEKRVNQAENKSSPKVSSDQVNNEKSKTEKSSGLEQINNDKSKTEKSSGMEQIDAYFDKKLYHKVVDVFRDYFKDGNKLPLDKNQINYLRSHFTNEKED
jgi:hypothetical protein